MHCATAAVPKRRLYGLAFDLSLLHKDLYPLVPSAGFELALDDTCPDRPQDWPKIITSTQYALRHLILAHCGRSRPGQHYSHLARSGNLRSCSRWFYCHRLRRNHCALCRMRIKRRRHLGGHMRSQLHSGSTSPSSRYWAHADRPTRLLHRPSVRALRSTALRPPVQTSKRLSVSLVASTARPQLLASKRQARWQAEHRSPPTQRPCLRHLSSLRVPLRSQQVPASYLDNLHAVAIQTRTVQERTTP